MTSTNPFTEATVPNTFMFTFTSFNPNILNCDVYGPRSERWFTITTGHGSTVFHSAEGNHVAFIDWQLPPSVEIRGVVPYQPVSSWMRLHQ
ncbi:hypothetical protein BD779DRAFT_1447525 [Infundibulicybe gibba]|nr:hypothetical protein BD779DRAFT_1447525 [Infundibulicybe gibba]